MQISQKIGLPISSKSTELPQTFDDKNVKRHEFKEILNLSGIEEESNNLHNVPEWVNNDYHYDPANPRKPNMRELMEALSGKNLSDLYADPNSNWQELSKYASEILFGVTTGHVDPRDWNSIMKSEDIPKAARKETNKMHQPTVEIVSETDKNDKSINQHAVLKDKSGNILRAISGDEKSILSLMENFGANSSSVPKNIEKKITDPSFDPVILGALRNFRENTDNLAQISNLNSEVIAQSVKNALNELTIEKSNA